MSDRETARLNQLISLHPTNVAYRRRLLSYYYSCKRFAEALAEADKILEIEPSQYYHHIGRALCLQALGHTELALEEYQNILLINPEESFSCEAIGDIYREQGRTEEARRYWERAFQIRETYLLADGRDLSQSPIVIQLQRKLGTAPDDPYLFLTQEQEHFLRLRNRGTPSFAVFQRRRRSNRTP